MPKPPVENKRGTGYDKRSPSRARGFDDGDESRGNVSRTVRPVADRTARSRRLDRRAGERRTHGPRVSEGSRHGGGAKAAAGAGSRWRDVGASARKSVGEGQRV